MAYTRMKLGMVGGGKGASIGNVHRRAVRLCGNIDLCAGALSSTSEKSKESGKLIGLLDNRTYGTWEDMLNRELALPVNTRIDAVSIVTPNHLHYPVAKAFAEAGIHVICDKPLVNTLTQAQELCEIVEKKQIVFAITYNYTGYPLIKQARAMCKNGEFGEIRKVVMEYSQGWLKQHPSKDTVKQAEWRLDPNRSGIAGVIGDVGSHAENMIATVTGLEIAELCADVHSFVNTRKLDDDGNVLVRYTNGARGVIIVSRIASGEENGIRLKVYGDTGGLTWKQEFPNTLTVWKDGQPEQIYKRANAYLYSHALAFSHTKPGHPEGFLEAFSSIYMEATRHILAVKNNDVKELAQGFDYPTIYDGTRSVRFIEKVIESSRSQQKWIRYADVM